MLNFDADFDRQSHGDVDVTCKQTFRVSVKCSMHLHPQSIQTKRQDKFIKSAAFAIVGVQCEKAISVTSDCATSFGLSCNNKSYVSIVIEIVIHVMSISSLKNIGNKKLTINAFAS